MSTDHPFLAITVGNTRTSIAILDDSSVVDKVAFNSTQTSDIVEHSLKLWKTLDGESPQIVMASTNESAASTIAATLADQTSKQIWQIGEDVPVAIG